MLEQTGDETGVDAAVSRGQGQIPADKVEAFKNTMARMYQVSTQAGTAGSAPSQAAGQTQPPKKTGEPSATGTPGKPQKKGSQPKSATAGAPQQQKGVDTTPAPTQGFVELQRNATPAVLTKLAQEIGVEEDRLKKLATTRGVRVLFDPDYLKVQ